MGLENILFNDVVIFRGCPGTLWEHQVHCVTSLPLANELNVGANGL